MRSTVSKTFFIRKRYPSILKKRVLYRAVSKNCFFSPATRFNASYYSNLNQTTRFVHATKPRNYCFIIRKYGAFYSATQMTRHMTRRSMFAGFFPGYKISSW